MMGDPGTVKAGKDELEAAGVPVVGAVLNFASAEECSYLRHESYGPAREKDRWFWIIPKFRIS